MEKIDKTRVPYKYFIVEYSDEIKAHLYYLYCIGQITKEQYKSVKNGADYTIKSFINNKTTVRFRRYAIKKCDSLRELIDNLRYQIGDVTLLNHNGSADADFFEMKRRICAIAEFHLQGARENKEPILRMLQNLSLDDCCSYDNYDSVHVKNGALSALLDYWYQNKNNN